MKPVLILQHQTPENLAYLQTWLQNHNIDFVAFNAEREKFPTSMEDYSALAVMGGAMSANEPLLSNRQAEILILQSFYYDKPVIGHCLGGQLMAKALGAKINKSYKPEIGWQNIQYTDNPLVNEWFGTNPTDKVIHWHYESFELPKGSTLLASSEYCENQAFSIGKHLAMQFHIEIDETKVHSWVNETDDNWEKIQNEYESVQNKEEILSGINSHLHKHMTTADNIYTNWLKTTIWHDNLKIR